MNATPRELWITGIGLVTPLGVDRESTWQSLCAGRSGIGPLRAYDASGQPVQIAGEVPGDLDQLFARREPLPSPQHFGRFTRLALLAGREALDDAGLATAAIDRGRAGVAMGVGGGAVHYLQPLESAWQQGPAALNDVLDRYFVIRTMFNAPAGMLSVLHRLEGPSTVVSAACSSGALALATAASWIREGRADLVLAGGADSTVSAATLLAYQRAGVLTASNELGAAASRPFHRHRNGFVMAEGAAALVLEAADHAERRGAPRYARLRGVGLSSEAYRPATPILDGSGMARTIRLALADAGLAAGDVALVCAHATSTVHGDLAEARALNAVFGAGAGGIPVTAPKSLFGHAIGASSAIQAAFGALAVRRGVLPPTANLTELDPQIDLAVVQAARAAQVPVALCNAFGFGGHNAALLLSA